MPSIPQGSWSSRADGSEGWSGRTYRAKNWWLQTQNGLKPLGKALGGPRGSPEKAQACTKSSRGGLGLELSGVQPPFWDTQKLHFGSTFRLPGGIQNWHRFQGLFWEHSASSLDWRRCTLASKLQGQLDVDNFVLRPFRERSRTIFGVPHGSSGSSFPSPGEASKTMPIPEAAVGAPKAKCTHPRGLQLSIRAPEPCTQAYIYIYICYT